MICFVILSETVSRLMLFKMDIAILRVTVPVVRFFTYSVLFPLIFTFRTIQGKLEDIQQKNEKYNEKTSAEDEIMSLVENDNGGRKDESLEEDERRMIRGIFDLDDTLVREIMTPRVDIKGLSLSESIEEARKRFIESGHSRIPVYEENVDQIKGLVFAKDFLDIEAQKNKKLIDLMHVPVFIPETKAVSDLLDELKKTGNHMAVIIDEYGGTAGIVTLEDIIEEIVGEIQDEYDTVEDQPREPETLSDGSIVFEARTQICDVNELLETDIPEGEEVDTIGGYVCSELGRIPLSGEKTVIEKNISVTVLKADNRKITLLKLKKEEEDVKRNKE
jgi:magnesium and cobalt transporter